MAFVTIPSTWLEVGKALKKELFDYIKENFDNHETRLNNVEAGLNKVELFNFSVEGYLNHYSNSELQGLSTYQVNQPMTITEVKMTILNGALTPTLVTGSAGVTEINLLKSSDNGVTWVDILKPGFRPQFPIGTYIKGSQSGAYQFNTGAEILAEGDLVRLDITQKKDAQGSFLINVFAELS